MAESFALKGAARYLREKHDEQELAEVMNICRDLAADLSKSKGYLHPRALAAASSHIYLSKQGNPVTLENSSASFRISSATLREYLRTTPATSSSETAKKMLENKLFGVELREALKVMEGLNKSLKKRKNSINPSALAASSIYITHYKDGKEVSLTEISREYGISTSTLRDYVGSHEEAVDPTERAKTMLGQYLGGVDDRRLDEILQKVTSSLNVSTARILAAIAYYLYTVDQQKYVTIERVARDFNVSIPALRSYLEPYLPTISQTYLLFKKGEAYDIPSALEKMNDSEKDLLNQVYANFGTNIFELSLLFDIGGVPRGRWQLFIRKMGKLGLLDVYKKPLDPRQYCALVGDLRNYLTKPERLDRWV
jgi:AcrR family transcriptional regulator